MKIEHAIITDKPTKIIVTQFRILKELYLTALSDNQLYLWEKEKYHAGQWNIKYKK